LKKQLTLFAEDSHAKTSALQEKEQDLKAKDQVYGQSSKGSSKKSNRSTQSLKTSQPFDLEDWIKFSGKSLRSGMMRNGIVSPLPPLVRLTDGIESGSWPTPRASEYKDCGPVGSKSHLHMKKKRYLCAIVKDSEKPTGKLNPQWLEWLMGFPVGWTVLNN